MRRLSATILSPLALPLCIAEEGEAPKKPPLTSRLVRLAETEFGRSMDAGAGGVSVAPKAEQSLKSGLTIQQPKLSADRVWIGHAPGCRAGFDRWIADRWIADRRTVFLDTPLDPAGDADADRCEPRPGRGKQQERIIHNTSYNRRKARQ